MMSFPHRALESINTYKSPGDAYDVPSHVEPKVMPSSDAFNKV
jgi:hypothetical protein